MSGMDEDWWVTERLSNLQTTAYHSKLGVSSTIVLGVVGNIYECVEHATGSTSRYFAG